MDETPRAAAVMMLIGPMASIFNPGRYGDGDTEPELVARQRGLAPE